RDVGEPRGTPDVLADAVERHLGDHRTDVVQYQTADRTVRLAREQHADDATHRGTHPVHLLDVEAGDEGHHVGHVERKTVVGLDRQPVAAAAADHVGADHPVFAGHRAGEIVEIAAVAGEAVDTDQHPRVVGLAPLGVGHAVQAVWADALHAALAMAVI